MMHRANQEMAQQSKKLGDITALLAYETSADSASMMTIAAMTMLFLPATFISVRFIPYGGHIAQSANMNSLFSAWGSSHSTKGNL